MFVRAKTTSRSITQSFKRFNSSHHEHHVEANKPIEISISKVFGIAALAGAALVYKNHERTDAPLVETALYKDEVDGKREQSRNDNYAKRYKTSFIKGLIRDKGGIGQRQYRRLTDSAAVPTNLIPSHSPFGKQFGVGINTETLGPRRERVRVYAPVEH